MSAAETATRPETALHLSRFPARVLDSITKLLSSFSIGWLYFCGDNSLNAKFRAGGVRTFVHRPDRTGKRLWPSLVSRFQLKTFCLAYAPLPFEFPVEIGPTYFYLDETLDMIQPSLTTLKVSGDFRFETVDLVARFPNLKCFALSKSWDIDSKPSLLPLGLKKLMVTHPDYKLTLNDLPETLTYIEDTVLSIDFQSSYSPNLRTLMLGTRVKMGLKFLVPPLPPTLTRLLLGPTAALSLAGKVNPLPPFLQYLTVESLIDSKIFGLLPAGLLSLRIYGHGEEYHLSEFDMLRLPRGLTQLDVPHRATREAICYLPRSLTLYEGLVSPISASVSSMLPHCMQSLQGLFEGENINLPPRLLELDCSTAKLSLLKLPSSIQRLTAWTACNTFERITYPSGLTSLVLVGKLWIDKNTFSSHSQLKHISVVTAQEDLAVCHPLINSFRDLPRYSSLSRLVIVGGIFPDFLFSELPATLESFSFTDGYFAMSSSLCMRPEASLLTERCLRLLPPNLRHLQLRLSTKFDLSPLILVKHDCLRSIDVLSQHSDLAVDIKQLKCSLPQLRFLAINSAELEQDLYIYSATDNLQLKLHLHVQMAAGEELKPHTRLSIDPLAELM